MAQNEQLDLALNFVQFTDKNIFLTGKAGTGKTTFLHNLKKSSHKRMAVVAPTGVAAINAGGVTIHSFFQMPFGPFIPGSSGKSQPFKRFSNDKINLIRSLDLLVIDEISMVRADTLDGIDEVLKKYKDRTKPFGGVQLLMIGDLHQLSPVIKDEDWQILKDFYPNLYFFSSNALQKTDPVSIELKHIYRQVDTQFIDLLNSVRGNKMTEQVLTKLNQRYIPNFNPSDDEGYITLTTHNRSAQEINEVKLSELDKPIHKFSAVIADDFPEYAYPTVPELELKLGAQVMFVKNDPSRERNFYNGKIGKVMKIDQGTVYVKCPGDYSEIPVEPLEWENIKYELNTMTKEVEEKKIGSFTQYPLKLAWAITIHKSQGLTFEKAIIDANAAFAHGQVYVALSRCKSFEGMVLRSPISFNSIKTDGTVDEYSKNADENAPDENRLISSKIAYQQSLIYELFNFNELKSKFFYCTKIAEDNNSSFEPRLPDQLNEIKITAEKELYEVAETFKKHLANALNINIVPEDNVELQARIKKACIYFAEKIENGIYTSAQQIITDTDNKAARASFTEALDNLQKEAFIKLKAMKQCTAGFQTLPYLQTKANADIDYRAAKSTHKVFVRTRNDISHAGLYAAIKSWRDDLANKNNIPVYIILPQKTLLELVKLLPSTLSELQTVKGMGSIKVKQYGEEILNMISSYCEDNNIERGTMEIPLKKEKKIKLDSPKASFDLYKAGKTIPEIAAERGFVNMTIEGHLANFITTGEISIFDLVSKSKVAKITAHLVQNPSSAMGEIKLAMGEAISYGDIKAVINHLAFVQSAANEVEFYKPVN
ncbi:MAG TPA: helicase [Sphingobacteriaceae bacterium]|nr:helicase [Sphingobacteriaceae bacterium]